MSYIDETIAHFQEMNCRNTTTIEELHFNNNAINALHKRKAQLVDHKRTFWRYTHYCPSCSTQLFREGVRYCDSCGQALDWSNYELGLKYVR
jgi:hypothetical protein